MWQSALITNLTFSKDSVLKHLSRNVYRTAYFNLSKSNRFLCGKRHIVVCSIKNIQTIQSPDAATDSKKCVDKPSVIEQLVNRSPRGVQPYLKLMRIDKPIGTWLLLWPCYWSISLASAPGCLPNLSLLALFGAGALLMRGAGCTINDLWDRDIDAKVARTKSRPLASGDMSVLDAWMFLGGQLSLGALVLLQLNWNSILLGVSSLALVAAYPLVKRVSYWPQLMLGLTFNWGVMLGWCAVHSSLDWSVVLPLYLGCISWTMIYDTIYAHQDKIDDLLIKIKSTALKFNEDTKGYLLGFSGAMLTLLCVTGYNCDQAWPFYTSVGLTGLLLTSQIKNLDINDPQSCWKAFKSHKRIGVIIFVGIVFGNLLKDVKDNKGKKSNILTNEALITTADLPIGKAFS